MTEQPASDWAERYTFTTDWFSHVEPVWDQLLFTYEPARVLEIGSFEGRSACFLINRLTCLHELELHCIDTWEGGLEHADIAMQEVEERFDENIALAIASAYRPVRFRKHKGRSSDILARMLARGRRGYFDFIYIDGSHQVHDVLADAVQSFLLLKPGGLIVFDDYAWSLEGENFYELPKPAIDAFVNIFRPKLKLLHHPLYQLYVEKVSD